MLSEMLGGEGPSLLAVRLAASIVHWAVVSSAALLQDVMRCIWQLSSMEASMSSAIAQPLNMTSREVQLLTQCADSCNRGDVQTKRMYDQFTVVPEKVVIISASTRKPARAAKPTRCCRWIAANPVMSGYIFSLSIPPLAWAHIIKLTQWIDTFAP